MALRDDKTPREPLSDLWAASPVLAQDSRPLFKVSAGMEYLREIWGALGRGVFCDVVMRNGKPCLLLGLGEDSYVPAGGRFAEFSPLDAGSLRMLVSDRSRVVKVNGGAEVDSLFPLAGAKDLLNLIPSKGLPNARVVRSVAQAPVFRPDGSLLSVEGLDAATGVLLHLGGLVVPAVPECPGVGEVAVARALLEDLVCDFPFSGVDDHATWQGFAMLPLLRGLVAHPYPLLAISAPTPGTGKSYLARLLREIYGGTIRTPWGDESELRKSVTTILRQNDGAFVQFDNLRARVNSPTLEGMLTSEQWHDRLLGSSEKFNALQDRIWIVTGNNLVISGEAARRTRWVRLNAEDERPEARDIDYAHPDLFGYTRENRGRLIAAQATLVANWIALGRPAEAPDTGDSFGAAVAVLRGIWAAAGGVGAFGGNAFSQIEIDPIAEERGQVVYALRSELVKLAVEDQRFESGEFLAKEAHALLVGHKLLEGLNSRGVGEWLHRNKDVWIGGMAIRRVRLDRNHRAVWRIEHRQE